MALVTLVIVKIIFEALACIDYMNRQSVDYLPLRPIYGIFIFLVLMNVLIFAVRWILVIQKWAHHLAFFEHHKYLYSSTPAILFQLKYTVAILLHDGLHKFLVYFYFVRYKPATFPLTFWTFGELVLDLIVGGVRNYFSLSKKHKNG